MATKQIWVTPHGREWEVKRAGGTAFVTTKTQREALERGRDVAREEGAELIWQGKDGKVVGRSSYGNDPRRSKG